MAAVYRPVFGRVITVAVIAISLAAVAGLATTGSAADVGRSLPWLALLGGGCWAVLWRPRVEVSDGGVRLVNVTRTIDVPWPAITDIETRWALTLHTAYGAFRAWAAPSTGRTSMRQATRVTPRLRDLERQRPADQATHGPASEAGALVQRRWEQLRAEGHLDHPVLEHERAPVRWHAGTLAAGVALVVGGVSALIV